nr:hypothetical protein [Tanacetum cinerariifolium]
MIGYSALCDNDKQHRKKIDEQEILFDKMSHFKKTNSPFQQTSSLKPYVPTVILEKIIIDLEDEVVSLLKKEKENLKIIESLKSKGFESSENAISESKNQSENDCQVVEKGCDQGDNSKVIALGMFKLMCHKVFHQFQRQKHLVLQKSNTSNDDLSSVSHSKLNKDVKRYSRKEFFSCNNSHLEDTRNAYACNDAVNVSCNSSLYASYDENDLFIFDDVSVRNSQVSKMPFRKKPRDSMNIVQICLWIIDSGCSKYMTEIETKRILLDIFKEKQQKSAEGGTIPSFYKKKPEDGSISHKVQRLVKFHFLKKQSDILLNVDDLDAMWVLLKEIIVSLTQVRIDMSELDEDSDDFLQHHEMEAYIPGLITNLAQLRDTPTQFVQMYCHIAYQKFFFCDPNRRGKPCMVLLSNCLQELIEPHQELREYADGTLTDIFIERVDEHLRRGKSANANAREMDFENLYGRGFLTTADVHTLFRDVHQMSIEGGNYELCIEDVQDEIWDMVKPADPLRITLSDLLSCKQVEPLQVCL